MPSRPPGDDGRDVEFCLLSGPSMTPTLARPDVLEVVSPARKGIVAGDVVVFRRGEDLIVHRVVEVTPGGIRTRGDNNCRDDPHLQSPADVLGVVVAAWRGERRRKVPGGGWGRIVSIYARSRNAAAQGAAKALSAFYRQVASRGPLRFRPQVIRFQVRGRAELRLAWGSRIVGRYDRINGCWVVRPPYRAVLDLSRLPSAEELLEGQLPDGPI